MAISAKELLDYTVKRLENLAQDPCMVPRSKNNVYKLIRDVEASYRGIEPKDPPPIAKPAEDPSHSERGAWMRSRLRGGS